MAIKIAETFYTLRKRVRQRGENVPNVTGFSGSSGIKIPFSALKNKRMVSTNLQDPTNDRTYAVTDLEGHFAGGSVVLDLSFHKPFAHSANGL